jgi:hypothetical protein
MNSVRGACRGCKTGKPIFLLFRLVESTLEGPPGRIRVSHVSVMVQTADFRFEIADFRFSPWISPICNLKSAISNLRIVDLRSGLGAGRFDGEEFFRKTSAVVFQQNLNTDGVGRAKDQAGVMPSLEA